MSISNLASQRASGRDRARGGCKRARGLRDGLEDRDEPEGASGGRRSSTRSSQSAASRTNSGWAASTTMILPSPSAVRAIRSSKLLCRPLSVVDEDHERPGSSELREELPHRPYRLLEHAARRQAGSPRHADRDDRRTLAPGERAGGSIRSRRRARRASRPCRSCSPSRIAWPSVWSLPCVLPSKAPPHPSS
jgi:hypothetical protein